MSIGQEQPPLSTDEELSEYLNRRFIDIGSQFADSPKFPERKEMPYKPQIGDVHYFGNPSTHNYSVQITAEGFWGYTRLGWVLLGGTMDYALEVAKGNIPGTTGVNKFGVNLSVTADTMEDVWDGGGTYPFPTIVDITHISQDADQVAMRGGNIEVQGLDENWELVIQTIPLDVTNTTTAVVLTTPLLRCFRMKVMIDVVGDQDIRAHNVGDTATYAIITAGNNQTLMALYTVPAGKSAYITNYYASQTDAANKTPTSTGVSLWSSAGGTSPSVLSKYEFQVKHVIGIPSAGNLAQHVFNPYAGPFPEKTEIIIRASPADQDANISAGFDLYLVDNAE